MSKSLGDLYLELGLCNLIDCDSSVILNAILPSLSVNYGCVLNGAPFENR